LDQPILFLAALCGEKTKTTTAKMLLWPHCHVLNKTFNMDKNTTFTGICQGKTDTAANLIDSSATPSA
jgi:hypothetical protein